MGYRRRSRAERSSQYKEDSLPITNLILVDHSQTPLSMTVQNTNATIQVEPFIEASSTHSQMNRKSIQESVE